jgi:hypothetical protein
MGKFLVVSLVVVFRVLLVIFVGLENEIYFNVHWVVNSSLNHNLDWLE